jgi:pimeloyl-ACP methyl ester carboxylesterase
MHYIKKFHSWLDDRKIQFGEFEYWSSRSRGANHAFYAEGKYDLPVVVILHSTGCDKYTPLIEIYKMLLESGYSVFSFDLDGHGRDSTHVLDRENILAGGASEIINEAITAAKEKLKFEKIILLGQSLGGCIAMEYCLQLAPLHKIEKLVCIGSPLRLDLARVSIKKELSSAGQPSVLRALKTYGFAGIIPALGSFRRNVWPIRCIGGKQVKYLPEIVGIINGLKLQDRSKDIDVPTVWVAGGWDSIAQGAPRMKNLIVIDVPHECHFSLLYCDNYLVELRNLIK